MKETLDKIEKECKNCIKCDLSKNRTKVVFGKGNKNADIMFIGEAPGEKEDLEGIPFVGKAGKELDQLLNKINLNLEDVYIANILKCRPPKNRDPTKQEIITCTPYLIKQIELIKPKVIATLGNYSTKFVLAKLIHNDMKKIKGISTLHGQKFNIKIKENEYTIIPIYHPAAMMYRPKIREDFETDFNTIKEFIKE